MTRRLVTVVLLLATTCEGARAQEAGFRAWVALLDGVDLARLENGNRLASLCPDPASLDACRERVLAPRVTTLPLFAAPDLAAPRVGDLLVTAAPGRGLSARFSAAGSGVSVPFVPDLVLQDWGYGPYFHHTAVRREDDWFLLPSHPWEGEAWLRVADEAAAIYVNAGDILEMDGTGWYVVSARQDALLLRPGQPADLWCGEGDPPPLEPVTPLWRSRAQVTDAGGRLRFRLKYMKGC